MVAVLTTLAAILHHGGLVTHPPASVSQPPPTKVSQPPPPPTPPPITTKRSHAVKLGSGTAHDENEEAGFPRSLVSGDLTCSDVYSWLPFISPQPDASAGAGESRSIMLVQVI